MHEPITAVEPTCHPSSTTTSTTMATKLVSSYQALFDKHKLYKPQSWRQHMASQVDVSLSSQTSIFKSASNCNTDILKWTYFNSSTWEVKLCVFIYFFRRRCMPNLSCQDFFGFLCFCHKSVFGQWEEIHAFSCTLFITRLVSKDHKSWHVKLNKHEVDSHW